MHQTISSVEYGLKVETPKYSKSVNCSYPYLEALG